MKKMKILYIAILFIFCYLFDINLYYDLRANQLEFTNHKIVAGTPGNRTQLCIINTDNGFEGRGEHQQLNHSQIFNS